MSNTKAAPAEGRRGARFDIAWALPRNEFQVPGVTLSWWHDSNQPTEPQARHRVRELEPFMTAHNGCIAIYRVDFDQTGIISEHLVHSTGNGARPPRRSEVRPVNRGVSAAFQALDGRWRERGGNRVAAHRPVSERPIRVKPRRRRSVWDELGQNVATIIVTVSVCAALGTAAVLFHPTWKMEKAPVAEAAVEADPHRYDLLRMKVRNDYGSCDSIAMNNRTGRVAYYGRTDCEARETAEAEPPRPEKPAPRDGLTGVAAYFHGNR